jgi:hypothetical protein
MARARPFPFGHGSSEGALISPGIVVQRFAESEAIGLAGDWLKVFGSHRKGVDTEAFLWHIFSAGRFPSIRGAAAIEEYQRQTGVEFVILSNDRKIAFLTDRLPEASSLADYYVFPPNLAWTMAFTHEDGWLGPYFAKHPDFRELNEINQSKVRKMLEAEAAKRKGWC